MNFANVNYNGIIIPEAECVIPIGNRAFRYGDGLFESMKIISGKVRFSDDHFQRLTEGMKALAMVLPLQWTSEFFREQIESLVRANEITAGGRLRFTVFRTGQGFYAPLSGESSFLVEATATDENAYALNSVGLEIGICTEVKKTHSSISAYKTLNSLPYVLSAIWASTRKVDDAIILNEGGNIAECISSNIFIALQGKLYTPSLSEGPIGGVMRKKIIGLAERINMKVIESAISPSSLEDAEEVFLTNAYSGIRWVSSFGRMRYFHKISAALTGMLNESVA